MRRTAMIVIVVGCALAGIGMAAAYHPVPAGAEPAATAGHAPGGHGRPMAGFDTCTAPSLQTMRVWRAKFSAVGIYIGGEDMACSYGHLSAAWVKAVQAMGWSLLPIYVGPQPPCDRYPGRIDPKRAAAEGRAAAAGAVADATMFGIGRGSPIYYDIEAYNRNKSRCVTAVLTFLDAWTRQLDAKRYLSGVYSSAGSAIIDLASASQIDGHRLAKPQCVWVAFWNNRKNLSASPYLGRSAWPQADLSKQYSGPHLVKVGGITLSIDSDLVDGPVVREGRTP